MRFHCKCGSSFAAENQKLVDEHEGRCPPCYDLLQVLAFANSVGKVEGEVTITPELAIETIVNICRTRLGDVQ
jgi:hypothetical protein